ncbi:diaminopimelate epimerase [Anaeromyxobacter sp. PSR-1]|uniref:diaminopimelate epimerase n=1 Tax=Anaeromyxobacter sp. PSR-1 TaxID=1300915 RepID=UPI0005E62829|nr:diaminopimelate epimerase [Anaeromyxobacter sp. PSR-1]GAO01717.1 diaminopimelate epimerase [Anaeromyxobacter sp. PSR-1]
MMRRVPLPFVKYHGLGNDFVVVDGPLMDAERARRICDRRRGVGADGVLTVLPPRTAGAAATMHIFNSDGSVAAMCGNGIRCVARHLADTRGLDGDLVIDTDSGPKRCTIHRGPGGAVEAVSVEMGPARLEGEQPFRVDGEALRALRVSMGNPHAVLFDAPERARALAVGPAIERLVPGGVNVGFARPGPSGIDLVVWERGAGLTDACGTGACAAAVASVSRGLARAGVPVEVRLPGGALAITVAPDLVGVTMRGPAERAFTGETDL